ncbi:hypothetical protein RhiirC2_795413 [Rhizophagus irregularis]|uniref:Uncharacterized protein n=1 Tax=Rhizophagus irregularis TaxID=588596 RepID=A0A2N1MBP7_9GLOM|nr:hypothetical protein RhiirC2_795413 [Rhizophagus irregularis]
MYLIGYRYIGTRYVYDRFFFDLWEYHINKNRVHDIWNDCERFQQNGNHFLEELRKVQSISSVPPSENNPQEKENNHPISGSLDGPFALAPDSSNPSGSARTDPFHESIEINAQEKQKKKKKDRIESEEAIRESEKFLTLNPPFHYIQTKNTSQGSH